MLEGAQPRLPDMADDERLASVHSLLFPLEHSRAGFISTRLEVWQYYIQRFGTTAKAQQILQWLQHGLNVHWVSCDAAIQQKHPRYRKKVQLVRELLHHTSAVGSQGVEPALQGKEPQRVHFTNCISVGMREELVDGAICELVKTGAISTWTGPEPITVINGLGLAVDRNGKKRLILDARYINLFDRYEGFSYEGLSDVPQYLQPEDYIMLKDLKAGYHQVKMHPSTDHKLQRADVLLCTPAFWIVLNLRGLYGADGASVQAPEGKGPAYVLPYR